MNSNLLLDIAELSLTRIIAGSSVAFVGVGELYEEFVSGNTLCKSKASFSQFHTALKTIFPIYKNKRKRTKIFKLSSITAYAVCESMSIRLRPLSHINKQCLKTN